jgi:hypothetical protein
MYTECIIVACSISSVALTSLVSRRSSIPVTLAYLYLIGLSKKNQEKHAMGEECQEVMYLIKWQI